eukprot:CAMPEP_0119301526 /NCGR_PEP_ID=MMETSP1333-20130426/3302_1 /TAXON_ID=418940 /ORGANISM="Scyphosphaera apsteinii, Strain RCC1455" /LENGTH=455 /DNA_ID=CAMNT_0007303631 /DNA_START=57 /DNA_END=1424 /DNA_ORIENTATION=+
MPPARRKSTAKAPPNRWTRAEIEVLLSCLRSEDFMHSNAPSMPAGCFPELEVRDACIKEGEYHHLCVAIAKEILTHAGEHNNQNLRPFASIAQKIQDMLSRARQDRPDLGSKEAFEAFDVEAFAEQGISVTRLDAPADGSSALFVSPTDEAPPPKEQSTDTADNANAEAAPGSGGGPEPYDDTYVPPVRNGRDITFQTRILNPHLVCTLCMGYFKDACTIIECLHTFCRGCILRHFRDSHVCPTCDSHLGTNPKDLVRTDRTLQSIVDKVFPQFAQKEAAKRVATPANASRSAKAPRQHPPPPLAPPPQRQHVEQPEQQHQQQPPLPPPPAPQQLQPPPPLPPQAEAGVHTEAAQEISFSLQESLVGGAVTTIARLEKPYLRTSTRLTVAHLKKYLAKKMRLGEGISIEILCRDVMLPMEMTLERIADRYWKDSSEDLVLKYQVNSGQTIGTDGS